MTCLRCDSSLAVAERAPDAAAEEDEQAATPEAGEDGVAYWERCVTIYCERLAAEARERGFDLPGGRVAACGEARRRAGIMMCDRYGCGGGRFLLERTEVRHDGENH